MSKYATAAIGSSAPLPGLFVDPIVAERTIFNADRSHRFTLFRHWGDIDDYACGISMNPSGASEDMSDPTVEGVFGTPLWQSVAQEQSSDRSRQEGG